MNQTFSVKDTHILGKSRLHSVRALQIQFNNRAPGGPMYTRKEGGGSWDALKRCLWRGCWRYGSNLGGIDLRWETWAGRSMIHVLGVRMCVCLCVNEHVCECVYEIKFVCENVCAVYECAWEYVCGCLCVGMWVSLCESVHDFVCVCACVWCMCEGVRIQNVWVGVCVICVSISGTYVRRAPVCVGVWAYTSVWVCT